MIINDLINSVRYPDEIDGLHFDATPYDKTVEFLRLSISSLPGQLKIDMQETLDELERRWEERQAKTRRIEIPAKKISSTV